MRIPRGPALLAALFLFAGLAACDDPITPEPQQIAPTEIAAKSAPTDVRLDEDFTGGIVFIHLTDLPNEKVLERLADAGIGIHPVYGEIVSFDGLSFVSAHLPGQVLELVADLPFVTMIESAIDPVGIFPMGYGFSDGHPYWDQVTQIRADEVWEQFDHFGHGPGGFAWVSVIDVGLDKRPDRYSSHDPWLWYRGVYYKDEVNGTSNGHQFTDVYDSEPGPYQRHGTIVASIIAADHDSPAYEPSFGNLPLVGIAPHSILIFSNWWDLGDSNGVDGDWTGIVKGLTRAKIDYVDVVNISFGNCGNYYPSGVAQAVDALKTITTRTGAYGTVVVASAGNGRMSAGCPSGYEEAISYPAADPDVIAVGGIDQSWNPLSVDVNYRFSHGSQMDFVALGTGVRSASTDANGNVIPARWGSSGAHYPYGTSFAAPVVTGAVALLRSHDPSLSRTEIRERLKATAQDAYTSGWDEHTGYGVPDIYAAITYDPVVATMSEPYNITSAGYYTWSVSASGGDAPYTYSWRKNGYSVGTGSSATLYVRELDEPSFILDVTVTDASGETAFVTRIINVNIGGGRAS